MLADIGLMETHVVREPLLAGKAVVVLPRVAEQHRKCELVARAEIFRFEEEVRDLGEAASGRNIGALEDDIFSVFENVAYRAVHAGIIGPAMRLLRVIPGERRMIRFAIRTTEQRCEHFLQATNEDVRFAVAFQERVDGLVFLEDLAA